MLYLTEFRDEEGIRMAVLQLEGDRAEVENAYAR